MSLEKCTTSSSWVKLASLQRSKREKQLWGAVQGRDKKVVALLGIAPNGNKPKCCLSAEETHSGRFL